jgi:dUTP pyrophosphatase
MSEQLIVKIKKLNPKAVIPQIMTEHSAGFDLVATSKKTTEMYIEYGTGLAVAIPVGYCGIIQARSSVSKKSLMLANGVGLIDADYRGELLLRFKSVKMDSGLTSEEYEVGDAIAQLRICAVPKIALEEVEELDATERGEGGFGHTDKKRKKK